MNDFFFINEKIFREALERIAIRASYGTDDELTKIAYTALASTQSLSGKFRDIWRKLLLVLLGALAAIVITMVW